jgi:hypothetical protein
MEIVNRRQVAEERDECRRAIGRILSFLASGTEEEEEETFS